MGDAAHVLEFIAEHPQYMTLADFARMHGAERHQVQVLARRGQLDHIIIGRGRKLVRRDAVYTPLKRAESNYREGEQRCSSCFHWLVEACYGKGKWGARGAKCMDCEASASAFRLERAKCHVLDTAYLDAIPRDKSITTGRREGRLIAPGEDRIAMHAASVAFAGQAGDGRDWRDA